MDGFEDGGGGASRPDRPRGVNFKKIAELKDSSEDKDIKKLNKKVQVFYKKHNRSTNEVFMTFPAEYLAIFSDRYRSAIWDENIKAITIVGGDKAVYKEVFEWMLASVQQDPPAGAPTPEYDESIPDVFKKYASLIAAADYLQIPARDFADPIIKKTLFKLSRDKLMSWKEVDFYIEHFQGESDTDDKMREVLTNSIANAWWKGNLREDEDEDLDDYCVLSVLREEHSQLDEDLHTWCEKNETRIRGKWAEKDAQKNGTAIGGGEWGTGTATAGGGDWDIAAATTDVTGDWNAGGDAWASKENGNATSKASGGWEDSGIDMGSDSQKENIAPAEAAGLDAGAAPSFADVSGGDWDDGGIGGDWAEEVNTEQANAKTSW